MRKESLEFLKNLLSARGPSGFETSVQKVWHDYVADFADEIHTNAYGNIAAVVNPQGDPKIMLDAHVDEIGLMVKHIDDKGFIYFQKIGGVDPAVLRGLRVNIHTAKGIVRGVVAATAFFYRDDEKKKKVPKIHEIYIDIGAKDKKDAQKRVAIGDPITFSEEFKVISGSIITSRSLDDRAGIWTIAEALRLIATKKRQLKCAVYACSVVQEELGLHGAAMNVINVEPHAAIAVDVTHATDTPGIDRKQHGEIKLGQGPTVSIGRENHRAIVQRLRNIAEKKKLKLQIETFSITGGTDALAIYSKLGGVPSAILGLPNRYMHTAVELVDLNDLQTAADLLSAFCLDIKKGERFSVKI